MMDDIDREVCSRISTILGTALPKEWELLEYKHHDPAITLIYSVPGTHYGKVRIDINYGTELHHKVLAR